MEIESTTEHAIGDGFFVFITSLRHHGKTRPDVYVENDHRTIGTQFGLREPRRRLSNFIDLVSDRFPGMGDEQRRQVFNLVVSAVLEARSYQPKPDSVSRVAPLSRTVSRLVASAADRLTSDLYTQYASAWETDALWLDGRWERLRFALALRLWGVRRLRREAARAQEHDVPRRA